MAYGKSQIINPEVKTLELAKPSPEVHALLLHTQRQLRRVANQFVKSWLAWHEAGNSLLKMVCQAAVHPCPPQFCSQVLQQCLAICPDVHCATVLAVTNWLAQTYTRQTSPRANEKRWRRVLRGDESHWSYQEPLPIRLWSGNTKVVREAGRPALIVRLDRFVEPGKKNASSTPVTIEFVKPKQSSRTAGHREAYLALCEIADGTRKLAQSQLFFVPRRGKWFLSLTVSGAAPEEQAARDLSRTIVVRPGRMSALRIRAGAVRGSFGEDALDKTSRCRRRLDERRASYLADHPGRRMPGHLSDHLSGIWRRQAAAICDALAAEVCAALKGRDFGRVLWLDGNNRCAALARAGCDGEDDRRELFPFEQLRRKVEKRLGDVGIEVVGRANFRSVKRRIAERRKKLQTVS